MHNHTIKPLNRSYDNYTRGPHQIGPAPTSKTSFHEKDKKDSDPITGSPKSESLTTGNGTCIGCGSVNPNNAKI